MSRLADGYMGAAKRAMGDKPKGFARGGEVEAEDEHEDSCPHCGADMGGVAYSEKMPTKDTDTSQMKMDEYQRRKALFARAAGGR